MLFTLAFSDLRQKGKEQTHLRPVDRAVRPTSKTKHRNHTCKEYVSRRLRGGDDKEVADSTEMEGEAELWIIRFAQNPTGHSLYSALVTLDQSDTVDKCWRATLRPDRAPKGGLQSWLVQSRRGRSHRGRER